MSFPSQKHNTGRRHGFLQTVRENYDLLKFPTWLCNVLSPGGKNPKSSRRTSHGAEKTNGIGECVGFEEKKTLESRT